MSRIATVVLACLLPLAGAIGIASRGAAEACGPATACCGGDCRCGDDCTCAVDEAPTSPADEAPGLPERLRGERLQLLAVPFGATVAVARGDAIDLGIPCAASSELAAAPSCRLRLALVSRWTT
jgi:hypothetical protein